MSDDAATFRARADAELTNARTSTLDNVRERCERAAKAWNEMADRAERTTVQRNLREAAATAAREQLAARTEEAAVAENS